MMPNDATGPHGGQLPSQVYSQYAAYSHPQNGSPDTKSLKPKYEPHKENLYPTNGYVDPRQMQNSSSLQYQQSVRVPSVRPGSFIPHQTGQTVQASSAQLSRASSHGSPSKPKAPTQPPSTAVSDHSSLLLILAEDYFEAAYTISGRPDAVQDHAQMQEYCKLVATGLGFLEAVLVRCKLRPEQEATLRLRYATVVFEETENLMEAEESLSKGIAVADRYKLFDLKYNMQHLLVRILHRTSPPAAIKFLDGVVKDAEAYRHVAWVYALRFLKVSLLLEVQHESRQDIKAALATLKLITSTAEKYGDVALLAVASVMKALVSLRGLDAEESFEEAQRSLATVRSLQTNPAISNFPQLNILAAFADLSCHLKQFDPSQAVQKMQILQTALAAISDSSRWTVEGAFSISLVNDRMPQCRRQDGIVRHNHDGSLCLMINWKPKEDVYNVGYLLSAMALTHRNSSDGHKSEQMLQDGIRREAHAQQQSNHASRPIMSSVSLKVWRQQLSAYMHLHLAFILCARSSRSLAERHLQSLKELSDAWSLRPPTLSRLASYLKATYYQGTGHLNQALSLYEDLANITRESSRISSDLALLATLNYLLIIRHPTHKHHNNIERVYDHLTKQCTQYPNRQIQSAYHLITATLPLTATITGTKHSLHQALESAKSVSNNQVMCMVLNIMAWKFFRGVIGEQAEKSARASQAMAKRVGDDLWMCVSAGVVSEHLEAAGRIDEAEACWREGCQVASLLPPEVKKAINIKDEPGNDAVERQEAG